MGGYYNDDDEVGPRNPLGVFAFSSRGIELNVRDEEMKKDERICSDDEVEEEEE